MIKTNDAKEVIDIRAFFLKLPLLSKYVTITSSHYPHEQI